MLQRDHPSPSFKEADPNTLRPPGASQTVDPESVGQDVTPGRMGENDAATQEGPQAQGAARVVAADEHVVDTTKLARDVRSPHDKVEELAEGGAAALEESSLPTAEGSVAGTAITGASTPVAASTATPTAKTQESVSAKELLRRHSPATMAGAGPGSIIAERVHSLANAGMLEGDRDIAYLAQRMMNGQLMRFISNEEKAAVEVVAKRIAERRSTQPVRVKFGNTKVPCHTFAPLPERVRQKLVRLQVAGRYPTTEFQDRPLLNNISKLALRNDTYLSDDRQRFIKKVQSLLPKPPAPKQTAKSA
jgi:hypothetical protein